MAPSGRRRGQIAGAIHASARGRERIGQEALRRRRRPAQIAAREPRSADPELPRLAIGDEREVRRENIGGAVADRPADRRIGLVEGRARFDLPDHRRDHRLRRPIAVDQQARTQRAADALECGARHRLAAEGIALHLGRIADGLRPGGELGHIARRKAGMRHAAGANDAQRLVRRPQLVAAQHDRAADEQRRHPALMRAVEREGEEVQLARALAHLIGLRRRRDMHGERPVLDGDAFRTSRRAGCVDHISEAIGVERRDRRRSGVHGQPLEQDGREPVR